MKRLMIVIACVGTAFCADIDQPKAASEQTVPQVKINFIDPEKKEIIETGSYPQDRIDEIPALKAQQQFNRSKGAEAGSLPLELSIEKETFERLIKPNPIEDSLDFQSAAELIQAINLLQVSKLETPAFKANIAKRIAADLNEHRDQYAKMIPDILQYKTLLNEYFKNNELSDAITLFINSALFSGSLFSLFTFQEKPSHDLSTYNSLCLSFDGSHIFQGTTSNTETTLNKRDLVTGDIVAKSSIPTQFEDPIEYLATTNQYVAAQLRTGRIIILDQASLQMKYEFSLEYVKEDKKGYLTLTSGSEQKGFPENYFLFIEKSPFWGKFSFSPDGTYLLAYSLRRTFLRKKDGSFDQRGGSGSEPMYIIDMRTGVHRFFWPTPDKSLSIFNLDKPLFSNDAKQIYYFAKDKNEWKKHKLWITHVDSLSQEFFDMPDSLGSYKSLYEIANVLWIRSEDIDKSAECLTFNTNTKALDNKGDIKYFKLLYLSDIEIASAANENNSLNYKWTLRSPPPPEKTNNSLYLNNPKTIASLQNPTQGKLLKQIQGADFSFEALSFDKRTFIAKDLKSKKGTARYVFQKGQPLPFDIAFGILCFQKVDDFKILGPIRTALRPSIDTLPQEIKPVVQKYFTDKITTLFQKNIAAIKQLPTGLPSSNE